MTVFLLVCGFLKLLLPWVNFLKQGMTLLMMGSADALPEEPVARPVFVEDMTEEQLASAVSDFFVGSRNILYGIFGYLILKITCWFFLISRGKQNLFCELEWTFKYLSIALEQTLIKTEKKFKIIWWLDFTEPIMSLKWLFPGKFLKLHFSFSHHFPLNKIIDFVY